MIDHLVLAAPDLAAAVAAVTADWGITPVPGGAHAGRGTRNELTGLGDGAYLEIIGPDPDQPAPAQPRPFGVDLLDHASLVAWCARPTRPLDEVIAACDALGVHLGEANAMSRTRPDGVRLDWRLTFPLLGPPHEGTVPFLIDWQSSPHPADSLPTDCRLLMLELRTPRPDRLRAVLDAVGHDPRIAVVDGSAGLRAVVATPAGERTING